MADIVKQTLGSLVKREQKLSTLLTTSMLREQQLLVNEGDLRYMSYAKSPTRLMYVRKGGGSCKVHGF
jgi:hypothetical protein